MKYTLIFILTFYFGVSTAQRIEKIGKVDLMNHFKEDIDFWQENVFKNLSNSKQGIINYSKLPEAKWSQSIINGKEVQKFSIDYTQRFDSLGNPMGSFEIYLLLMPRYIAISDKPELRNKIGFGFQRYSQIGEKLVDFILFHEINNWPNLKDKRRSDFLKLLSDVLHHSKPDSVITLKINDRDSKLQLFNLGIPVSDSLPVLNFLADILLKGYEKDFGSAYYSGKDSSYEITYDQYGNSKMIKGKINENMTKVYNTNEKPNNQNKMSSSFNMSKICLSFEKQTAAQIVRKIYPGVYIPSTTSSDNGQGNVNFNLYLSPLTLKRFSPKSQTLIDYLIQIYN
jgi:hypothetical protein